MVEQVRQLVEVDQTSAIGDVIALAQRNMADAAGEFDQCPGNACDRDTLVHGEMGQSERPGSVDVDAGDPAASAACQEDIHMTGRELPQVPVTRRTPLAQARDAAHGHHGSERTPVPCKRRMPDRVDASVDHGEMPGCDHPIDLIGAKADVKELATLNDPVLNRRKVAERTQDGASTRPLSTR